MKILLTGSDGFIGSNLRNTDYHFHCLDTKSGKDIMTCELPDVDIKIREYCMLVQVQHTSHGKILMQ